ncbi:hypothetical protein WOLCODRAFT_157640, partial [Wolfiporia cocos MD-104 SS10]
MCLLSERAVSPGGGARTRAPQRLRALTGVRIERRPARAACRGVHTAEPPLRGLVAQLAILRRGQSAHVIPSGLLAPVASRIPKHRASSLVRTRAPRAADYSPPSLALAPTPTPTLHLSPYPLPSPGQAANRTLPTPAVPLRRDDGSPSYIVPSSPPSSPPGRAFLRAQNRDCARRIAIAPAARPTRIAALHDAPRPCAHRARDRTATLRSQRSAARARRAASPSFPPQTRAELQVGVWRSTAADIDGRQRTGGASETAAGEEYGGSGVAVAQGASGRVAR